MTLQHHNFCDRTFSNYFSFLSLQLLSLRKKLKQEEEVKDVTSRINKLNEIRGGHSKRKDLVRGGVGTSSGGSGGGTGIWRKLKAKKKKQRNFTSPEITKEELRTAISTSKGNDNASLTPLKENDNDKKEAVNLKENEGDKKEAGKEKGKKQAKEKASKETKTKRRKSKDVTKSNVVVLNLSVTPSDSEELSQRSNPSQSLTDNWHNIEEEVMAPLISTEPGNNIVLKTLNLSQASDKNLISVSPSNSTTFIGNEERLSTRSSSDVAVLNSSSAAETESVRTREDRNSGLTWDSKESRKEMEEDRETEDDTYGAYLQGCTTLYKDYGTEEHRLNLNKVQEFLESSGEMEPVDLLLLQEWDGWVVAVRDIM